MTNLILFLNSFMSYLLVVAVFLLAGGTAVFAGIKVRKRKDAKTQEESLAKNEEAGDTNEV